METVINSEKLINLVEARPAIWDMRHGDYADKIKKRRSWEDIVNSFIDADASEANKKETGRFN